MDANTKKKTGQVFTPTSLVNDMLNIINYKGSEILNKHIIDNSCRKWCISFANC